MAWSTPRTYVTGELITAAILNTHIRDQLTYLYGARGVATMHFTSSNVSNVLTIAHGLSWTPTFVSSTSRSTFYVVANGAPDATNVYLQGYQSGALNGDFPIYWQAS
jgi:hypothetical protein